MDGTPDALIGSTTTKIPGERSINVRVGGRRVRRQEGGCRHKLSRLAIPALRHFFGNPGTLQWMAAVRGEALDRRHRPIAYGGNGSLARAGGHAVKMHCAGTAEANAAAKFGAGQPKQITQYPEERHSEVNDCDSIRFPVDGDADVCHTVSFQCAFEQLLL